MKPILPGAHTIIDYLLTAFLALAPKFWGFTGYPAHLAYTLAFIFFVMSLLTDYSGGLIKIIGFAVHGLFELIIGVVVIVIAYRNIAADGPEKHFFILFGIGLLMFWVLSDYNYVAPEDKHRHFNTH